MLLALAWAGYSGHRLPQFLLEDSKVFPGQMRYVQSLTQGLLQVGCDQKKLQSKVPRHLNWIFQQKMKAFIVCTEDRHTLNSVELKARRPQPTHPSTRLFFFHLLSTNGVDRQYLQTPPSFLSEVYVQFDSRWHVNTWEGKQNHFCCGSHLSGCHQDYHDDNQITNSLPRNAYFCIFVYLM